MLGGKMIMEIRKFWRQETRRGRPKVLKKAAKIVFKKARYKLGDSINEEAQLSHSQRAKFRKGYEKLFKMLKIRGPWESKKNLCLISLPSNAQLVSNL